MTQHDLYVSTAGDDQNPGTLDAPLATIARALDLRHGIPDAHVTIHLRAGTYYDTHLQLRALDSRTTIRAYQDERATLSAGAPLECDWKPWRDGIYQCHLPDMGGVEPFVLLFVNGRRMIRARFPNYDASVPGQSGYVTALEGIGRPTRSVRFDPATWSPRRWAKPHEAVFHGFPHCYYGSTHYKVTGIDYEQNLLRLGEGGWQLNIPAEDGSANISNRSRFYVENVFEELDAPGEWYFDRETLTLYFYPPAGVDLKTALVEVAGDNEIVGIMGYPSPVHHVRLENLRLAHTEPTLFWPYFAPSRGDWTISPFASVRLSDAEDVTIIGCHFDQLGGNAIFLHRENRRVRIEGCLFNELGDSAVCIVGKKNETFGTCEPFSADIVVHNCHMRNLGYYGKQVAGVFISQAKRVTVSHCLMHDLPRSAITMNDGTWGGHIIEFNYCYNTVLETTDHGPFNSWGRDTYWCMRQSHGPASHDAGRVKEDAHETTIIRNNLFVDKRGWGIDLDDGSSNYLVTSNLCIGISVKLREGDFRTVENNIFYHPANPPGFHVGYENNSDIFRHNIIVVSSKHDEQEADVNFDPGKHGGDIYKLILPPATGPWLKECDHNIFFNDKGFFTCTAARRGTEWWKPEAAERMTLEQWQAMGFDEHSIFADPLFEDPENNDFAMPVHSPAVRLGFDPFPLDQFGLTEEFPEWLREHG